MAGQRIAINAWFIDRPTTGSGQYLTHLLSEFVAHHAGGRYLLCTRPDQALPPELDPLPSCCEQAALRTPFDGLSDRLSKVWFEQVSVPLACRRWQADLLHVPYWASPLFSPVPIVVTVHDLIPMLLPPYRGGWVGAWYARLVRASARRATRVITDSEASRRDILQHLRIAPERVGSIYLAAHPRFRPVQEKESLAHVRHKYALPDRYLLYLGGFDVRKNVTGILRAYAQLEAGVAADTHLVIAGSLPAEDSDFFPDPRRVARELGIVERVRFTGWVDEKDKPGLYSAAEAFLFPSHYEGFGLPPLEAMSCGTPVIASDRGSLPEVVGQGGLSVDPEDTGALAQAMAQVLSNPDLRARLREAALVQAGRFGWDRTAAETVEVYRLCRAEAP